MAANQPGSRAALVTTLVIFVLLFFVSAFYAWQNISEVKRTETALEDLKKKVNRVVPVADLDNLRPPVPTSSSEEPYYYQLQKRADDLQRALYYVETRDRSSTTRPGTVARPVDAVVEQINRIRERLSAAGINVVLKNQTLTTLDPLANIIIDLAKKNRQLEAANELLAAQKKAAEDQLGPARDTLKPQVDQLNAALTKAGDEKKALAADYEGKLKTEKDAFDAAMKAAKDANQALDDARKSALAEAEKIKADNEALTATLGKWRPPNLAEATLRHADGEIIQIGKNNVVYINLGMGQQVYKGLTFEVYDRTEGIPRVAGVTEEQLPAGKASLEVINVGPGSSECRLIKTTPDQPVVVGDIIANLIYDPNVKWNFRVYGEFDVDGNGVATTAEAEVVKRLVKAWGGRITDQLNFDTDFLVIGREPQLPRYSKEEIEKSPTLALEMKQAEAKLKEYDDIKQKALQLHIPVLNQNRFLYLVGYYDQARR